MVLKFGHHIITMLYLNLCYNEVCYKGTALYHDCVRGHQNNLPLAITIWHNLPLAMTIWHNLPLAMTIWHYPLSNPRDAIQLAEVLTIFHGQWSEWVQIVWR